MARRRAFITRAVRRYAGAVLFILLGTFIVSVIGYVSALVPEINLTIGTVSLSNRLFINFIAWVAGIVFVLTGVKKLGLSL